MYERLIDEIKFKFTTSSGPGGQSVNRVSTKVELRFDVEGSKLLSPDEKIIIITKLYSKINSKCELTLFCDETRSQKTNRDIAVTKFLELIKDALKPAKKRKQTRPSRASKEKRLKDKKIKSEKKNLRKNDPE